MENQNERFVFYEFLLFFWRKKWLFLIIPLVTAGLGFLFSSNQNQSYQGSSTIFVGGVTFGSIAKADLIQTNYRPVIEDEQVRRSFRAFVPTNQIVRMEIQGTDKTKVETELQKVTDKYYMDLLHEYKKRQSLNEKLVETFENKIAANEKALKHYQDRLTKMDSSEETDYDIRMVMFYEGEIYHYLELLHMTELELFAFEEPQIVSQSVTQKANNTKPNVILSFIAGLFLTVLTLVLWKYINEAREAQKA